MPAGRLPRRPRGAGPPRPPRLPASSPLSAAAELPARAGRGAGRGARGCWGEGAAAQSAEGAWRAFGAHARGAECPPQRRSGALAGEPSPAASVPAVIASQDRGGDAGSPCAGPAGASAALRPEAAALGHSGPSGHRPGLEQARGGRAEETVPGPARVPPPSRPPRCEAPAGAAGGGDQRGRLQGGSEGSWGTSREGHPPVPGPGPGRPWPLNLALGRLPRPPTSPRVVSAGAKRAPRAAGDPESLPRTGAGGTSRPGDRGPRECLPCTPTWLPPCAPEICAHRAPRGVPSLTPSRLAAGHPANGRGAPPQDPPSQGSGAAAPRKAQRPRSASRSARSGLSLGPLPAAALRCSAARGAEVHPEFGQALPARSTPQQVELRGRGRSDAPAPAAPSASPPAGAPASASPRGAAGLPPARAHPGSGR